MTLRSILGLLATAASLLVLSSCASNDSRPDPYDENISNLPQNRPQKWEGNAAMGSFFPQSM